MNRIIKMQEEEYPMSSPSYDNAFFNNCLTTFYDQDSNHEIIQAKFSAQEVVFYLEHAVDLCDTPLSEIMDLVTLNANFKGVDMDFVRRKVIKIKNSMKRNRAKNRVIAPKSKKAVIELPVIPTCEEDEFKKQRNRISAQNSRDRKKEKVKELEELNLKLQQECQKKQSENEQLRKEVEAHQKSSLGLFGEPFKNKITKMLILLGIICLFGFIRDIFSPQGAATNPLSEINESTVSSIDAKRQSEFIEQSEDEKKRIFETIQGPITEIFEDKTVLGKIKDRIGKSLTDWRQDSWFFPKRLRDELKVVKHFAMS